jgi:hypothetical protein
MTFANSSVYWLANQSTGIVLAAAPASGSAIDTIATLDNTNYGNGMWVDDKRAVFAGANNGPTTLYSVSLSDGKRTAISTKVGEQDFGVNAFAADKDYVYVGSGGCPCNGLQGNSLPSGRIVRFAWDGSSSRMLAEFEGSISAIVVDDTSVYWGTDTTVWKVPKAGGTSVRIAGNLTNGQTPYLCTQGCGSQPTSSLALAVDDTSVYIADTAANVMALLRVSK